MKSIRNIALAIAAGGLLGAGAVLADDAKPADKPSAEKHEHGRNPMREKHGRVGEKHERMGGHGCPGMQQGRGGHDHS